ncbi:hypothetical protein HNR56_000922 [Roseospira marina]|nr:hypothetical protein [Roseospira marina]
MSGDDIGQHVGCYRVVGTLRAMGPLGPGGGVIDRLGTVQAGLELSRVFPEIMKEPGQTRGVANIELFTALLRKRRDGSQMIG